MSKIHVILADDQKLFVDNLKFVIESKSDQLEVVGIANNGEEAVELVRKTRPDIALLDIKMPKMDGVEATKIIRSKYPDTQVIILTTYDDDSYVHEALSEGAVGYLLKQTIPSNLIMCIMAVKEGSVMISPEIAQKLVRHINSPSKKILSEEQSVYLEELTKREKEVLLQLSRGFSNKQISENLHIESESVRKYISRIYSKIGIHNRIELIMILNRLN